MLGWDKTQLKEKPYSISTLQKISLYCHLILIKTVFRWNWAVKLNITNELWVFVYSLPIWIFLFTNLLLQYSELFVDILHS